MLFIPNQKVLRNLLQDIFAQRQVRNPSYSIRSFSRALQVNHSALSEIMRGKRKAGTRIARRIAAGLMLDEESHQRLFSNRIEEQGESRQDSELNADQFRLIAEWYHFALLSLTETEDFRSEIGWISQRLNCSKSEIVAAIDRLKRMGLLEQKKSVFRGTNKALSTTDGIPDMAIRKRHSQFLQKVQDSLERSDFSERDFTTMTMAIDPKKLPEARHRIRKFRDELCHFLEGGTKKEVFELGIQLIPLSKEV